MREFTKSMMSYTWAMSLFGVQQMVNIFRPSRATESFDNVTDATRDEFGDGMRAAFRAGDNLQRGMVDLTFGIFGLGMFNGRGNRNGCGVSDMGRRSGDFVRDSVNAMGQAADAVGSMTQGAASYAADAARQGSGRGGRGRGSWCDTDQYDRSYDRSYDRGRERDRSRNRCYDRSCDRRCGRDHDDRHDRSYDRGRDRDEGRDSDYRRDQYRERPYERGARASSDAGRQAADAVGQGMRAMGDVADAVGQGMEATADATADALTSNQSTQRGSSAGQTQSWGSPARGSDRSRKS